MFTIANPLSVKALNKRFGHFDAVQDVSFEINAGEIVALLGPSGCGKTTCLRMIAGLVEPTSGSIALRGTEITGLPVSGRNIGMLFQSYALFPHMTVAENVAFGLQTRRMGKDVIREKVIAALKMVQLESMANRYPARLSGGQQQRVALARALVIEPSLLLLDEPFGALDKNLRENMQLELRLIQRRLGMTTVFVTHDQEEALTLSDRIIVMKDGKIQQFAAPSELYKRPVNVFVAGFIGASNFFSGKIETLGSEQTLLANGGARLSIPAGTAGSDVTVVVRPESIAIAPLDGNPRQINYVDATVEQIIYRGVQTHYHLRLDDGTPLVAYRQNDARDIEPVGPEIGKRVRASWNAAGIHALRPE
ncbi:ABC transporter ATP-binding protein (plasmid) [Rhizobium sp. NIBRBAC000502774]|nr:ABC transporter ATP-binding protein [Rhizobium sp. NIBRBAC000502774]